MAGLGLCMAQALPIKIEATPTLPKQLVIPPIQTVCESYPIQEIPPTVPPPVFVGSFVYSIHSTAAALGMFQPADGHGGHPGWGQNPQQPRAMNSSTPSASPTTTQKRKREPPPREDNKNAGPDPSAAQAALVAFKNFSQDKQAQIIARYPDLSEEDLNKFLSQMWQVATDAEKKQYYANNVAATADLPAPKRKRVKKDPQAPKRNMSAFLFYSNDRRGEVKKANPNLTFSEIAKVSILNPNFCIYFCRS